MYGYVLEFRACRKLRSKKEIEVGPKKFFGTRPAPTTKEGKTVERSREMKTALALSLFYQIYKWFCSKYSFP
jgi:hypothetical protein